MRPILTEENRLARFEMAMDSRDLDDLTKYQDMHDQIHVDEKWFFLTQEKEMYLLHQYRKNPKHCVKHKSHITKVMFLCAVVRPCFNPCSNSWWDGKLGIWPIGDWEPAKQKSKNRPKGALVWKNKVVTKEVYQVLLISKLIPSTWRNSLEGTCCQGKFSFNKMGQKSTLFGMTSYSTMHW